MEGGGNKNLKSIMSVYVRAGPPLLAAVSLRVLVQPRQQLLVNKGSQVLAPTAVACWTRPRRVHNATHSTGTARWPNGRCARRGAVPPGAAFASWPEQKEAHPPTHRDNTASHPNYQPNPCTHPTHTLTH